MDESSICLDLYPCILEYCDYITLDNLKRVNCFCYAIAKKEQMKRLKSPFPFGEENAKIRIITKDINLEKITCIIENRIIEIPPEKYSMPYISEVLQTWFLYYFPTEKWILTGKVIKSIIRLVNKSLLENNGEILIFQYKNCKSYLSEIT
jgi:hypothetical protein